jgi:hypothetical protein
VDLRWWLVVVDRRRGLGGLSKSSGDQLRHELTTSELLVGESQNLGGEPTEESSALGEGEDAGQGDCIEA